MRPYFGCDTASALSHEWLLTYDGCRFIPDRFMRHHGISRVFWLVLLTALTAGSAMLNAFLDLRLLGLACTASGLAFGGIQGKLKLSFSS